MKVRIYLAGAIGCYGVGAEYPKLWRKMASEWFEIYSGYAYDYDFYCIDPTRYYEYGRDYHKSEKEVMMFDLRKVESADVILVNLKDIENPQEQLMKFLMHGKITFLLLVFLIQKTVQKVLSYIRGLETK